MSIDPRLQAAAATAEPTTRNLGKIAELEKRLAALERGSFHGRLYVEKLDVVHLGTATQPWPVGPNPASDPVGSSRVTPFTIKVDRAGRFITLRLAMAGRATQATVEGPHASISGPPDVAVKVFDSTDYPDGLGAVSAIEGHAGGDDYPAVNNTEADYSDYGHVGPIVYDVVTYAASIGDHTFTVRYELATDIESQGFGDIRNVRLFAEVT